MALFTFTPPHTVSIIKTFTAHSKSQRPRSTIMSMINDHYEKRALHLSEAGFICTSVGNTIATCSLHTGSWSKQTKARETWNWITWRFVEDHADKILVSLFWGMLCPHDLQQSVQVTYSQMSYDLLKMLKPVLDASQQAIQEMVIQGDHLPDGVLCQPASLLAHGHFALVTRN